jgi:large subunit ribosomal protein L24
MTAKLRVRKGDRVAVLAGKDKGKTGEILRTIPRESRVIVQGVNMVKRHTRPSQANAGGILEKEASIHVSNVALIDPKDDKPVRVGIKFIDARVKGEKPQKVRFARRSGEVIDS